MVMAQCRSRGASLHPQEHVQLLAAECGQVEGRPEVGVHVHVGRVALQIAAVEGTKVEGLLIPSEEHVHEADENLIVVSIAWEGADRLDDSALHAGEARILANLSETGSEIAR